jgi:hypothetical protein
MGYIDRSQFLDELKNNPGLAHRIAVIVSGETGNAPLETKIINAETIFNRAMTNNLTLEQATRQAGLQYSDGKGGYYPRSTFANGESLIGRGNNEGAFNEQVLKPVLSGSDVSTRVLGFPATGNASNNPLLGEAGMVAKHGINNGYYTNYRWLGKELYVNAKPDVMARLEGKRTGDPPVQPPGSVPNPAVGANEQAIDPVTGNRVPSTGSVAAAALTGPPSANYPPSDYPGYRLPVTQTVNNPQTGGDTSVPMPWRRPPAAGPGNVEASPQTATTAPAAPAATAAPAAAPAAATAAPAAATAAPAAAPAASAAPITSAAMRTPLGQAISRLFQQGGNTAPPGASSYVDPNTGHTIVNPSGSGEQAMGITRDIGSAAAPNRATAPPPGQATAPSLAPRRPLPPNSLDEGPTPPGAINYGPQRRTVPDVLAPLFQHEQSPAPNVSQISPSMFDARRVADQGGPGLTGLTGGAQMSSGTTPSQDLIAARTPQDAAAAWARSRTDWTRTPVPVAPEIAGLLAPQSPKMAPAPPTDRFTPQQAAPVASSRPPFVQPPNASTQLSPGDELRFQSWLRSNNVNFDPRNTGQPTDYDMRGFFQRQQQGDPIAQNRVDPNDNRMHYPDVWKTPSHETFGAQSMYSTNPNAPDWVNDRQMATPNARLTFGQQSPMDSALAPPQVFPGSPAIAPPLAPPSGGNSLPPIPMTQPTTVAQQAGGLSPFSTQAPMPQQMPFAPTQQEQDQWLSRFQVNPQQSAFASTSLLPFDIWPQTGIDTAGWNSPASYNFGDPG